MRVLPGAALCLVLASFTVAQAQAFAKITIKPAHPADPRNWSVQVQPNGDLTAHNINVIELLTYAYGVPANPSPRLNSVPGWVYAERYDIEAKAMPNGVLGSSQGSEAQSQAKQVMRQLLADGFKLVMHVEQRRMPAYALTVSGSGPKLQRSAATAKDCIFNTAADGCHTFVIGFGHPLNGNAVGMDDLADYIENWTDLPVVDRTGLTGLYTLHTEGWQPMHLPRPPPSGNGSVDFSSLPPLSSVLGKLGLELHREEAVLPVYTVERMERPAVN